MGTVPVQIIDAVAVEGTRRLADGHLITGAKCFRTGAQHYPGDEVGKPSMELVSVYRRPGGVGSDQTTIGSSPDPLRRLLAAPPFERSSHGLLA